MRLFENLFGTIEIESETVDNIVIMIEDVINDLLEAEKEAQKANRLMPAGKGLPEIYEIVNSAQETNTRCSVPEFLS